MIEASVKQTIEEILPGRVLFNEPMERHTSMGVGGKTDALAFPADREELGKMLRFLGSRGVSFLPVGNCTNLIVREGGYQGVLISLRKFDGLRLQGAGNDHQYLHAESGVPLLRLVSFCLDHSLEGMEFCAGIPGSAGGAVRMNAGAWGTEMKDVVHSVFLLDGDGTEHEVARRDLDFQYRNLDIPDGMIVTAAVFILRRGRRDEIASRISEILMQRKSKHPVQYESAGSIFKNQAGRPAGKLIEEAGLKGRRVGNAMVSEKHANFIVNIGGARAKDVTSLIELVRDEVFRKTQVLLEPEVRVVGDEG
ncbi:MAG: UDP-N-acetylmuramate dehydrogenase [Deltaproteobacteria bacterium]|nr:UDP-N-acetylmuramate dehydrogenase [Deltaproteobacteria bacterium]